MGRENASGRAGGAAERFEGGPAWGGLGGSLLDPAGGGSSHGPILSHSKGFFGLPLTNLEAPWGPGPTGEGRGPAVRI
jgi:hypothetical protein